MGRSCGPRGAHGRRARPAPAPGAGAERPRQTYRNRARRRVPLPAQFALAPVGARDGLAGARAIIATWSVGMSGMNSLLARTVVAIALFAVAALAAGVVVAPAWGWAVFCAFLAGLLFNHVRHLGLLQQWAARPLPEPVPEGTGIWREVFTLLYHRQRAESRRRGQLARLLARSRRAGRALPYGFAILDAEHRIVWCNDSSEAHFGIDAAADAGQPITNLVRQPEFVEYVAARDFSAPLQLKTARGDGLIVSVQFVPYVESQWLLLSRDVTQASRLETVRRDFVANV